MNETGFRLGDAFFEELSAALTKSEEELERKRNRAGRLFSGFVSRFVSAVSDTPKNNQSANGTTTKIPNLNDLKSIVNDAFWASQQREEGRTHRFSIRYGEPQMNNSLIFDAPKSFNTDEIAKLSPTIRSFRSYLGVWPQKDGLKIWGLGYDSHQPPPFCVKVIDPGQLIVTFDKTNIAAISGQQALPMSYPSLLSVWSRLQPPDQRDLINSIFDKRVEVISDILRAMRFIGHGGTLIIVPKNATPQGVKFTYIANPPYRHIAQILEDIKQDQKTAYSNLYFMQNLLDEATKNLAQLTAVDLATVINSDLEILGFGGLLTSERREQEIVIINHDELDETEAGTHKPLRECFKGSRHKTAAEFVLGKRDFIAFVLSQDGHVTAFVWEDVAEESNGHLVHAYQHLELILF